MIRVCVIAIVVAACSATPHPEQKTRPTNAEPEDAPALNYRVGPGGFPLPHDAESIELRADDTASNYQIQRPQAEVVAEMRANLAKLGFTIDKELPNGTIQWMISKGEEHLYVSIPQKDDNTMLIITVRKPGDASSAF